MTTYPPSFRAPHGPVPRESVSARRVSAKKALASSLLYGGCLLGAEAALGAGGDTQASATCISALPYMDTGTTVGATDDYDLPADTTNPTLTASCATSATGRGPAGSLPRGAVYTGTGTGPDVVYRMSFPAGNPDTLTITMDPTGSEDLALIVYCDACSSDPADGLAVSDTGVGGGPEVVTVSGIEPGATLYIVVDGYSTGGTLPGPAGAYTLSVASSGATQPSCALPEADLSVATTLTTPPPIAVNDNVAFALTASNAGPMNASAVVVAQTLPAGLTHVANDCGASFTSPTLTWSLGALAAGASATCNVTTLLTQAGTLTLNAGISGAESDPDAANNAASQPFSLAPLAPAPGPVAIPATGVATLVGMIASLSAVAALILRRRRLR